MIDIDAALSALSLTDKCRIVTGKNMWRTVAFPEAGIPAIKMSDGPNGIRGEGHGGGGTPGVVVPAGITLGATWDIELLGEIGDGQARAMLQRLLTAPGTQQCPVSEF